ncbi:IPT/TIG domain-containing protein [Chloracidobacterium sp. MS 40/45]|uniref:IPT/TIG domain-containing protein n=1 Tax=Chloracidobacterium aggregatum TaxID=2851959 RepID=UPI001B8C3C09|nr:IPT/TIG domain-containing protein [Chloracidobacterium aggregatum]QUW01564.1 IPT/TIG domain-containing protein [Chloracidobacterium sp. MS 40/45]
MARPENVCQPHVLPDTGRLKRPLRQPAVRPQPRPPRVLVPCFLTPGALAPPVRAAFAPPSGEHVSASAPTTDAVAGPGGIMTGFVPFSPASPLDSPASPPPLPPIISSFTPTSGVIGTTVTITGENFLLSRLHHRETVTDVRFNGISAIFDIVNSEIITATVPAGATTGPISVTNPAGTATSSTNFVVILPPTITSFSPASGLIGTPVIITGTNFTGTTDVRFNGIPAAFTVNSATQITATVPAGATTGPITVTNPAGTATSGTNFVVILPPTIVSFSPASGLIGTSVIITGTNFTGTTDVRFNGIPAAFTVNSATQITATVPAGATTGPITATNPAGTATSGTNFVVILPPTISSFSPTSGPVGTSVTLTGTNFTGTTDVRFNGVAATFTVNSSTQITATVPAGATTGPITVTTPDGTATSGTNFVVILPPTIASFSPTSGPVGTSVTITGTNFTGTTDVRFNGVSATFTVVTSTQITATVPAGATTGPITVTNPAGTATSGTSFVVILPPTIASFSPTSGLIGASVTLTGTNFTGTTDVRFNGVSATFTVVTSTQITATVPVGATTGSITVTNPAGTATSGTSFVVILPPTIASFSPTSGLIGASVTLTGTNFTGTTSVRFNGVTAVFTVNSNTQITATVPAGATTGPITVTNPAGTATSGTSFVVILPPTLASFSPASGLIGTSVTLTGTNFTGTTDVRFNGVTAVFTVNSNTQITATVPAGATTGPITVTNPAGTATSGTSFVVFLPPTIASFSPTSGPVGASVTITGTNFTGTTSVRFNGISAIFNIVDPETITATVPVGATTGTITVTNPAGTATSGTPFVVPQTPAISSFSPTAGTVGTSVTIPGMNFVEVTDVRFNGINASFTVNSPTQITATVPAGATTGPITVTNPAGTATSSASFVVILPPTITGFSPTSAPVGASVTITGTNFTGTTSVRFNGITAVFTLNSNTQITATVPAGATTGPITVTNPAGTATSSTGFVVILPPTISGFSPASGAVGALITISSGDFIVSGESFAGVTGVLFNGVAATFTVNSPAQITATVPAGATTGPISITGPGGTTTSSTPFVVLETPIVTGFSPTSGLTGTVVTISGSGFVDVSAVRFGGVAATFTVNSPTQITATVPPGAATGPISIAAAGVIATSREPFVVPETPTLTSFSPASGPVGTPVTITGTSFLNVSSVTFGDLPARFTVISPTQLTATVPAGAVTAPIRVTTPAGSATSATSFTVIPRVPPQTIGLWRPNQGFLLRQSNTAGLPDIAVPLGQPGDQPVVGDWDGDGKTTVALFRAGQFLIRNENAVSAPVTTVAFGQAGDIPVAGDWTGRGFDSVGVFRRGVFLLRNTNTSGAPDIIINYGLPTDLPVVGDWDGDRRTTVGAFRPSTGFFFLRNDNSSGNADLSFFYGLANDLPVAGDWDGDGVTTVGIFRAGTFFLRNTNTAGFADVAAGFGQAGDVPLAGRWKTPPVIPPGDFQTGNSTVVWRNQTTGETALWVMQGTSFVRSEALPFVEDCWVVGGVADFTGDGATDLLWRNQDITGFDAVWSFAGLRPVATLPVTPEQTDRNWVISCTGDFNRDGQPDIVRRNLATDAVEVWLMNRLTRSAVVPLVIPGLTADERIVGSGDFEGNGQLGLLLHRQAAGTARVVTFIGATAVGSRPLPALGSEWRLAAVGDYNRDGQPDVVWRNERTGQNVIWLLRNLSLVQSVALPAVTDQRWQIVGPR